MDDIISVFCRLKGQVEDHADRIDILASGI